MKSTDKTLMKRYVKSLKTFRFKQRPANFCLLHQLRSATPEQLDQVIADLANQMKKRRLEVADLYEEPLNRFGEDAVERWFSEEQVDGLIGFTEKLVA
jgi:hypothetical protein